LQERCGPGLVLAAGEREGVDQVEHQLAGKELAHEAGAGPLGFPGGLGGSARLLGTGCIPRGCGHVVLLCRRLARGAGSAARSRRVMWALRWVRKDVAVGSRRMAGTMVSPCSTV